MELVDGGYKAWRKLVVDAVQHQPVTAPLVVLDGNTGTAKTELLGLMAARDLQVIDLEGLANHRGSLFGDRPGGQPSQKAFEGRLALALAAIDPARPLVVEAESSRIGDLSVPKQLWAAMCAAPRLRIEAPRAARADYLARTYRDVADDAGRLGETIDRLAPHHPRERIAEWHALAGAGAFATLAGALMEHHYDPRYESHRARFAGADDSVVAAPGLAPADLPPLADRLAAEAVRIAR